MSEAVAPLREALAMSPDNVPLRLALARTLVDAGRPREALDEFREVLERDPSRAEVREELAKCAVACGRLEEAREVYAKGDGVVRDLDLERTLRGERRRRRSCRWRGPSRSPSRTSGAWRG